MRPPRPTQLGFTLIELLVVVSIIAMLIAILLPSIGSARRAAQLAQSISNLHQIATAHAAYASEHKGEQPSQMADNGAGGAELCSWNFGGTFADPYWAKTDGGGRDVAPSGRVLNEYLYPGTLHPPVTGMPGKDGKPIRPANESERIELDLPIFRDPRDGDTLQRYTFGEPTEGVTTYQDVGTSYQSNNKWLWQIRDWNGGKNFTYRFYNQGSKYLQNQTRIDPSRFVLYNDRVGDAIRRVYPDRMGIYGPDRIESMYGGVNRSAMSFFDGHAAYEQLEPAELAGEKYTFYFDQ